MQVLDLGKGNLNMISGQLKLKPYIYLILLPLYYLIILPLIMPLFSKEQQRYVANSLMEQCEQKPQQSVTEGRKNKYQNNNLHYFKLHFAKQSLRVAMTETAY